MRCQQGSRPENGERDRSLDARIDELPTTGGQERQILGFRGINIQGKFAPATDLPRQRRKLAEFMGAEAISASFVFDGGKRSAPTADAGHRRLLFG